jgi:hypothetical protein
MREIDPHNPIDKIAARVVSKVSHAQSEFYCGDKIYSMSPLPMRQFPGFKEHDLTGKKSGRFTVIGCALFVPKNYLTSRANSVRWVCRCTCGRYGMLTTKAIKKNHPENMCDPCNKVYNLRRKNSGHFNGA